ncbi:hypothetical protein HK102_009169 [Quaeritorhiza haematococci]|nr:hypothetical protein HK102_009169 [Quaeritorhiza haematococci]
MASLATFRRSLAAAVRVRPAFANQRVAAFSSFSYVRQASQVQKPTETDSDPVIPGFRAEGEIATNYELATGNERYEYFKKLAGEEPWEDLKPIVLDQPGTKAKPITLTGVDPVRYVGCTGECRVDSLKGEMQLVKRNGVRWVVRWKRRKSVHKTPTSLHTFINDVTFSWDD